jgi:hypothetical protein
MAPILTIFRIRSAQTKKTKEARWIAIQEIETQHLKVKKAESKCLLQIQDARPQSHQMIKVIPFKCRNDLCIVIALMSHMFTKKPFVDIRFKISYNINFQIPNVAN